MFQKYKEKIDKLENELLNGQKEIERLKQESERLRKVLEGDRVVSSYCYACKNLIKPPNYYSGVCKLNVKCKDFKG